MKRTRSKRSSTSSEESEPRRRRSLRRRARGDPSPAEATTRDYFAMLPSELATHIVELACRSSSPSTSSSSAAVTEASNRPPPSRLDVTTTLNLVLVSHDFYDLVARLLFHNVWLSRPSALERFLSTLEARPHLGGLVKSLYVGPDSAQPTHHSPLANPNGDDDSDTSSAADEDEWERARMSSTLRSAQEAKLLPRWCKPDRRWKLHSPESSVPGRAVHDALLAAQYAIDCYPPGAFIPGEDEEEGAINYCNGEWEVQAALDLYLIEMRRYEDQRGIIDAFSVPEELLDYPELVLTGYPSRSEAGDEGEGEDNDEEENKDKDKDEDQGKNNDEDEGEEDSSTKIPCTLTRAQLLQHLARPGSSTDQFDHDLMFSQSGIYQFAYHPPARAAQRALELFTPSRATDVPLLPRSASLGSILGLLGSVLTRTTNLENLALADLLSLVVCACNPSPPPLPNLKSLSIGPRTSHCDFGRRPLHRYTSLEDVRICDMDLHDGAELVDLVTQFPRLRYMHMSGVNLRGSYESRDWSAPLLACMGGSSALGNETAAHRRSHEEVESDSGDSGDSGSESESESETESESASDWSFDGDINVNVRQDSTLPLIEIELNEWTRKRLLKGASSAALREAWKSGLALPGRSRRILITKPDDYRGPGPETLTAMYAEVREWWEQHCGRKSSTRLC